MKTDWVKDVSNNPEARKEREEIIQAGKPALKVLKNILTKKLEEAERLSTSKAAYDKASWPYYQADQIGAKRTLNEIIELLDLGD